MTTPPSNKGRKFPAEPLSAAEVRLLMAAIPTRSVSGVRFRALVAVMLGAGLRISEALDLMPRDIDSKACTIHVRNGKGGKARLVGLDPVSCELLGRWMDKRTGLGLTGRHHVFATYSEGNVGGRLSDRYVRTALARYAEKAGLEKRVHPHGLRHTMAFDMFTKGVALPIIQQQLGHASLDATSTYVSHMAPTAVIDAMKARNPYED